MQPTDRWILKQKSPKPGTKLNILTEADVLGIINNKKNVEGGGGSGKMNARMNNFFDSMAKMNPFMSMSNNNNGMFMG